MVDHLVDDAHKMIAAACERVNVAAEQGPDYHRDALEDALHLALDALDIDWPAGYGTCSAYLCDADATQVTSDGPLCGAHAVRRFGP